jgi:hypothetical protein
MLNALFAQAFFKKACGTCVDIMNMLNALFAQAFFKKACGTYIDLMNMLNALFRSSRFKNVWEKYVDPNKHIVTFQHALLTFRVCSNFKVIGYSLFFLTIKREASSSTVTAKP